MGYTWSVWNSRWKKLRIKVYTITGRKTFIQSHRTSASDLRLYKPPSPEALQGCRELWPVTMAAPPQSPAAAAARRWKPGVASVSERWRGRQTQGKTNTNKKHTQKWISNWMLIMILKSRSDLGIIFVNLDFSLTKKANRKCKEFSICFKLPDPSRNLTFWSSERDEARALFFLC